MPKIARQIVLEADKGRSATDDDWGAVILAIVDATKNEIARAKENAYNQANPNRKESTDFQPSAPSGAASGREATA